MRQFLAAVYRVEVVVAVGLEALGAFWADRAARRLRRLGKLSAKFPGGRR